MAKRVSRSLSDVADEVFNELKTVHGVTDEQIAQLRARVFNSNNRFPYGGIKVRRELLWIDYEIQREPIIKHILNLLKKWDNRICQPLACYSTPKLAQLIDESRLMFKIKQAFIYDAQHRGITLAILGYDEVYITLVIEDDPSFASFAFRESNSTVKKIGPPDYHRNNIRLFNLGRRDPDTIAAHNLQVACDNADVDLMELSTRSKLSAAERKRWWFSHFKYAQTPMKADISGNTVTKILTAMTTAWPQDEEMDNCIFIGLHKMSDVVNSLNANEMPEDWMTDVCENLATSFKVSRDLTHAAGSQIRDYLAGGNWSVPESMYKFMRELYIMNGGTLPIPEKGDEINLANGDWCVPTLIPNHKNLYKARPGKNKPNTLAPLRNKKAAKVK
jgi:hypothetical protein